MNAQPLKVGARGIDSEPWSHVGDAAHATALKNSGIDFVSLYLGAVTPDVLSNVLASGLGYVPVCYASAVFGATPGPTTVAQMRALGIPAGVSVFLDLEGAQTLPTAIEPGALADKINAWADAVAAAGYVPGLYVGSPQPFSSAELYALRVQRYWRSPARVVDRFGNLAEPSCGWCMFQAWPSVTWEGVWVDVDFAYQDYRGRVPVACAA